MKEFRPLKIAPMGTEEGIPLMDQPVIPSARNFLGFCRNNYTTTNLTFSSDLNL
jgi:hypothetical protein